MSRYTFNPFTAQLDVTQTTAEEEAGSGGGQSWKIDQTPVESPNGSRVIFTLPSSNVYIANSLRVMLNGQVLTKVGDFTETTGSTFTFVVAPITGDIIRLDYRTS